MNYYIITKNTVLVMSVGYSCCRVYEIDKTFDVNKKQLEEFTQSSLQPVKRGRKVTSK